MTRTKYYLVNRVIRGFHSDVVHMLLRPVGGGAELDTDCPAFQAPKVGDVLNAATVEGMATAIRSAIFGMNTMLGDKNCHLADRNGSSPDTPPVIGVLHPRQFFSEKQTEKSVHTRFTYADCGDFAQCEAV